MHTKILKFSFPIFYKINGIVVTDFKSYLFIRTKSNRFKLSEEKNSQIQTIRCKPLVPIITIVLGKNELVAVAPLNVKRAETSLNTSLFPITQHIAHRSVSNSSAENCRGNDGMNNSFNSIQRSPFILTALNTFETMKNDRKRVKIDENRVN